MNPVRPPKCYIIFYKSKINIFLFKNNHLQNYGGLTG
jgi:hypothetical protein